jgi:hypothetical protein
MVFVGADEVKENDGLQRAIGLYKSNNPKEEA